MFRLKLICLVFLLSISAHAQLKYFGYYDCNDECINETAQYANVALIRDPYHPVDVQKVVALLRHAQQKGMKVIDGFVPKYLRSPELSSSQQNAWNQYVEAVKPFRDSIIAFYPEDEPYWNAWTQVGKNTGGKTLTTAEKQTAIENEKNALENIAKHLRQAFGKVSILDIESYPVVSSGLYDPPAGFDWLGFDCYDSFNDCHGNSIPAYVRLIEQKATGGQQLVVVAPAVVRIKGGARNDSEQVEDSVNFSRKYLELAKSDPRIVAILAFTYGGYPNPDMPYKDAQHADPRVRSAFKSIGQEVLRH